MHYATVGSDVEGELTHAATIADFVLQSVFSDGGATNHDSVLTKQFDCLSLRRNIYFFHKFNIISLPPAPP